MWPTVHPLSYIYFSLSVCVCVTDGRPNHWTDLDQILHEDLWPPGDGHGGLIFESQFLVGEEGHFLAFLSLRVGPSQLYPLVFRCCVLENNCKNAPTHRENLLTHNGTRHPEK